MCDTCSGSATSACFRKLKNPFVQFSSLVHGGFSEWSEWGVCSASCGSGVKERKRSCTNPVPSYGGLPCYGNSDEYDSCVMPAICPGTCNC